MRIDLHMHSTFSDGFHTPTALVDMAIKKKLAAISLTDHDCLDGLEELTAAGQAGGIEVITGVELSSEFHGRDLHILGYGVDAGDGDFQDMLHKFRETRFKRGIKIIEKLNALGLSIEPAEVLAKSGKGALGRPHIAAALVEKGLVSNVAEAFDRYIAEDGPAYVPKYKMSPGRAIQHIHASGGLAFAAHPGVFLKNIDEMSGLLDEGFDGVEVYHPSHDSATAKTLAALAEDRGLLVSGGSDFHGFNGRHMPLGTLDISYALLERIKTEIQERCNGKGL